MVVDFSVSFEHSDLRVSLKLNGLFSCFHKKVTSEIELYECEKLFLTSDIRD